MIIKFKSGNTLDCRVLAQCLLCLVVISNDGKYRLVSRVAIEEPTELKVKEED